MLFRWCSHGSDSPVEEVWTQDGCDGRSRFEKRWHLPGYQWRVSNLDAIKSTLNAGKSPSKWNKILDNMTAPLPAFCRRRRCNAAMHLAALNLVNQLIWWKHATRDSHLVQMIFGQVKEYSASAAFLSPLVSPSLRSAGRAHSAWRPICFCGSGSAAWAHEWHAAQFLQSFRIFLPTCHSCPKTENRDRVATWIQYELNDELGLPLGLTKLSLGRNFSGLTVEFHANQICTNRSTLHRLSQEHQRISHAKHFASYPRTVPAIQDFGHLRACALRVPLAFWMKTNFCHVLEAFCFAFDLLKLIIRKMCWQLLAHVGERRKIGGHVFAQQFCKAFCQGALQALLWRHFC